MLLALSDVNGRPLYAWSLEALGALPGVVALTLLAPARMAARLAREAPALSPLETPVVPVDMCDARSLLQAMAEVIAALPANITHVALHDTAIPVLDAECWARALAEVGEQTVCCHAQQLHDTIKLTGPERLVRETLPRHELCAMQTPLLATRAVIQAALAGAAPASSGEAGPAVGWLGTLVTRMMALDGVRVRLVPAGATSLPVRSVGDLSLAAHWVADAGGGRR